MATVMDERINKSDDGRLFCLNLVALSKTTSIDEGSNNERLQIEGGPIPHAVEMTHAQVATRHFDEHRESTIARNPVIYNRPRVHTLASLASIAESKHLPADLGNEEVLRSITQHHLEHIHHCLALFAFTGGVALTGGVVGALLLSGELVSLGCVGGGVVVSRACLWKVEKNVHFTRELTKMSHMKGEDVTDDTARALSHAITSTPSFLVQLWDGLAQGCLSFTSTGNEVPDQKEQESKSQVPACPSRARPICEVHGDTLSEECERCQQIFELLESNYHATAMPQHEPVQTTHEGACNGNEVQDLKKQASKSQVPA